MSWGWACLLCGASPWPMADAEARIVIRNYGTNQELCLAKYVASSRLSLVAFYVLAVPFVSAFRFPFVEVTVPFAFGVVFRSGLRPDGVRYPSCSTTIVSSFCLEGSLLPFGKARPRGPIFPSASALVSPWLTSSHALICRSFTLNWSKSFPSRSALRIASSYFSRSSVLIRSLRNSTSFGSDAESRSGGRLEVLNSPFPFCCSADDVVSCSGLLRHFGYYGMNGKM